jgi:hypothetical protein
VRYLYTDSGDCCGEVYALVGWQATDALGLGAEIYQDFENDVTYGALGFGYALPVAEIELSGGLGYNFDSETADWNVGVGRALTDAVGVDLRYHQADGGEDLYTLTLSFATDWASLGGGAAGDVQRVRTATGRTRVVAADRAEPRFRPAGERVMQTAACSGAAQPRRRRDHAETRGVRMADVNRGNRPLSPHLSIYRPQWTWCLSITHRATGVRPRARGGADRVVAGRGGDGAGLLRRGRRAADLLGRATWCWSARSGRCPIHFGNGVATCGGTPAAASTSTEVSARPSWWRSPRSR